MLCYKDKTFCNETTCAKFGPECHRSLTEKVKAEAIVRDMDVCVYLARPDCYEDKQKGNMK